MLILIVHWPLLFKSHWISKRYEQNYQRFIPKIWAVLRPQTEYFHAMNDHIRPSRTTAGNFASYLRSQDNIPESPSSTTDLHTNTHSFILDINRLTTCTLSSEQRKTKSKTTVLLKKLSLEHSIDFLNLLLW